MKHYLNHKNIHKFIYYNTNAIYHHNFFFVFSFRNNNKQSNIVVDMISCYFTDYFAIRQQTELLAWLLPFTICPSKALSCTHTLSLSSPPSMSLFSHLLPSLSSQCSLTCASFPLFLLICLSHSLFILVLLSLSPSIFLFTVILKRIEKNSPRGALLLSS